MEDSESKIVIESKEVIRAEKGQRIVLPMDLETNLDIQMEERQNQRFLKEHGLDR